MLPSGRPSREKRDGPFQPSPMSNADRQCIVPRPIVIVVDDDAAVRGSLRFALEIEGFAVRTHSSAGDLLNDGDLHGCVCLIIDQKLPGMTGLDLVSALRKKRILTPAILITSYPTAIVQEMAVRAGIPIVEKPLLATLLERVRDAAARPRTVH